MFRTKKSTKVLLSTCIFLLILAAHSSALAAEPWEGVFKGTSVLEKGTVLPDGVVLGNQAVELECHTETLPPPFTFIGYCDAYLEVLIPCGSQGVTTGMHTSPQVGENVQLDDLQQGKYLEGVYSPQDDTWTGAYHFDAENIGCDQYPDMQPFSVYFTVRRPTINKIMNPIYHLLL